MGEISNLMIPHLFTEPFVVQIEEGLEDIVKEDGRLEGMMEGRSV
jgi:hypothetical protein